MIKIIKEGIKSKKYKYIYSHTCTNCTCEFEFEEEDCTSVRHEKRIDGEYRGEIDCPFCSERLFIDFKTAKHRKEEINEESINPANIYINGFYQCTPSLCKCPNCGSSDTLVNNSFISTNIPQQYDFKCNDCGYRWIGPKQAPINTKLYTAWNNEDCDKCPNKNSVGDACYCCPHYPYKVTCTPEANK